MTAIEVAEVVDLQELQILLDDFSEATGLASVAVDVRGVPITEPSAFTDFCRTMRADPLRNQMCHNCDAHAGLQSLIQGAPHIYRCHAGLVDFSLPLAEGDRYLGAILAGQVRVPEVEQPRFLTEESGWNVDRRLTELCADVPMSTKGRVVAAAKMLQGLSARISGLGEKLRIPRLAPAYPEHADFLPLVGVRATRQDEGTSLNWVDERRERWAEVLGAEDLAAGYVEVSGRLDEIHRNPATSSDELATLEDEILHAAKTVAPRLVPHLSQVVARNRGRRTDATTRYQSQLYFERILAMVLDEIRRSRPMRRQDLRDLLNDIARRPNRTLSLTEAAANTHWSPGHLSKLFKSVTGCTFVSYVTAWRVARAQLMLACTQVPVQRIAAELGFNQVNYFSRVFRAKTGLTPSDYRRQHSSRDGRPVDVSLPTHNYALLRA